jgi:Raf kinase inhibitor-like YbhB/YbcL family protein
MMRLGLEWCSVSYMPYSNAEKVPSLTVTSESFQAGERLPAEAGGGAFGVPGGRDVSPQLSWGPLPEGTRSVAVSMYDPDAPVPSGFWHWGLADLPGDTTELPAGAGAGDDSLPGDAFHLPNEVGGRQYVGFGPPPGTGRHRYIVAVHALDVESVRDLGVTPDSTIAVLHFMMRGHTLARGLVEGWASADE